MEVAAVGLSASEVLFIPHRRIASPSVRCSRHTSKLAGHPGFGQWPSSSTSSSSSLPQPHGIPQRAVPMQEKERWRSHKASARRKNTSACATAGVEAKSQAEATLPCDSCSGRGWLICDFCDGKKTDVPAKRGTKFYRRCPTCRAAGVLICPVCSVYKCVTFPADADSGF